MSRIKRGVISLKRRKNVLKATKGFRWGRNTKETLAKMALLKAGTYAYRDRRAKKRVMRKLWIKRLGNAIRLSGLNYSTFINLLKKKNVALDRKVLAQIAVEHPSMLTKIVDAVR